MQSTVTERCPWRDGWGGGVEKRRCASHGGRRTPALLSHGERSKLGQVFGRFHGRNLTPTNTSRQRMCASSVADCFSGVSCVGGKFGVCIDPCSSFVSCSSCPSSASRRQVCHVAA